MLQSANLLTSKIFVFAILLTLFNCNKKKSEVSPADQNQLAQGVTVTEKFLTFESIDAYENFFSEGSENERRKLVQAAKNNQEHTSMLRNSYVRKSNSIVDSLYPDFLKTILNADGITKIGDYIIKVDMASEKVLVLKNEDIQYYDDLVSNNFSNTKIVVYSTNDEVLELLANGLPTPPSANTSSSNQRTTLFCTQNGAAGREDKEAQGYMTNWRFDCKAVYQKAGIYFSLIAKANKQNNLAGLWIESNDGFEMSMEYAYSYTPKCKGTSTGSNTISTGGTTVSFRPYESTTALKNFNYAATFRNYSGFVSRVYQVSY